MLWGEIYIFVTYHTLSLGFQSQRKHVVRTIYVRRSFQEFCTLRLRGQQDDAIVLIFATVVSQTSVKNNVYVLAGYVVPVLQNGALKWKKRLTGVRSRAVTTDHTLTRGLIPQVRYRKFWKSMDGKCFLTRCTVLT